MASTRRIRLVVNGKPVEHEVEARMLLSDFLREELELTGTHVGCEHGVCGACTVLVDDLPARSCLMLAAQTDGMRVETVESLSRDGSLHPLQQAFWDNHGLQCGFCTPGILMTLAYFLRTGAALDSEREIRLVLSGNLCRCTGYQNIVAAARQAARQLRATGDDAPGKGDGR